MAGVDERARLAARSIEELSSEPRPFDVVAIGASAGGVEALRALVGGLPPDFAPPLLIVLHIAQAGTSVLPEILDRAGPLAVDAARDGEPLRGGRAYVAPPNHHLLVEGARIKLTNGPRENGHRPAIDALLRSAAAFGEGAIGVILSGTLDDGTAGLREIAGNGGTTIVQDPDSALYAGMPRSAIEHVAVDAILPLAEIPRALVRLAGRREASPAPAPPAPRSARRSPPPPADLSLDGRLSRFTCPDCGGVLVEYTDGSLDRYRCSVGHAYSLESLVAGQSQQLEAALWAAVRSLEDRAVLLRRLEETSTARGHRRAAAAFEARALEAAERAALIHDVLEGTTIDPSPLERGPGELPDEDLPAAESLAVRGDDGD